MWDPIRALEVGGSAVASRTSVDMKPQSNATYSSARLDSGQTHEWTVKCMVPVLTNSAISSCLERVTQATGKRQPWRSSAAHRHVRPLQFCEKQNLPGCMFCSSIRLSPWTSERADTFGICSTHLLRVSVGSTCSDVGLLHRHSPCSYPKACGTIPMDPWSM